MDQHARADEQDALHVAPPRFVGREVELGRLKDALTHPPAVVLVEGEAGIVKSRLVREAVEALGVHGLRPLTAVCPPFREPLTLGPIVDAARQARADVSDLGLSALAGACGRDQRSWKRDAASGRPDRPAGHPDLATAYRCAFITASARSASPRRSALTPRSVSHRRS